MKQLFNYNKLISYSGKLLIVSKLILKPIMDAFGYGFSRNMVIDSIGNHDNALMGSYLLATTNNSITITGLLTTDILVPITKDGIVGIINTNNTISLINTLKYGAFEVYRNNILIGRYCLTERLGTQLINQYRGVGYLPNGLLNGTITSVWQKSNAYYSETNKTGYSIAGNGWFADSAGTQALTQYSIIPAYLDNPTKCLAWVGGVQQDLQFSGKARNSITVIPLSFECYSDRYWIAGVFTEPNLTSIRYDVYIRTTTLNGLTNSLFIQYNSTTHGLYINTAKKVGLNSGTSGVSLVSSLVLDNNTPYNIIATSTLAGRTLTVTNMLTGVSVTDTLAAAHGNISSGAFNVASSNIPDNRYTGVIGSIKLTINGIVRAILVPNQHGTSLIDTARKTTLSITGQSNYMHQASNCGIFPHIAQGYELWTNGTNYQMYPLADDGTSFITPAGYTLVETVAPNNMPSVADIRLSTVKYSLANSNDLYKAVPEAFNTDATVTPKVLSYSELSALTSNPNVSKSESNGKITNLKIIEKQ